MTSIRTRASRLADQPPRAEPAAGRRQGREVRRCSGAKYNRIGRIGKAFWTTIWALEDMEVAFTSVTQEIIDTTTPAGKFMLKQYAALAELDYDNIRDQFQDGIQTKAARGGWPGGEPPYGYRIEGKGKRGSYLVQDEREVRILKAMWRMVVRLAMNTSQIAARLNVMGIRTRSGRPWSGANVRGKLVSDSTLEAISVFRNPARAHAGQGARLTKEGVAKYGASVTIRLDPVFTPVEGAELRRAMARLGNVNPKSRPLGYPLSQRLFNEYTGCNSHHVGMKRTRREGRWYRRKGKAQKYPGDPMCSCDMVDADAIEAAVWTEVVKLLGDPDRLEAMAAEWVGLAAGGEVNFEDRLADLDRQIGDRERAVTTTVTEYAKAGLPAVAVQAATRALSEELDQLRAMRNEAATWMEETEAAEQRANDLTTLAILARERLVDMTPAEQAEVLALLEVKVTITGPVPRPRVGLACSMAGWFKDNERLVPDELGDEAWALAEPIVKAWEPPNHRCRPGRLMLDAMFYKARTGVLWEQLPERFGAWKGIHSRYQTWRNCGVWDEIMAALPDTGQPVWQPNLVPPLRIEGRVDPRLLTEEEAVPPEIGVPAPVTRSPTRAGASIIPRSVTCAGFLGRVAAFSAAAGKLACIYQP
ncbi:transposase [Streptomyces sp. NPDC001642]|uniref:transposase n=1 Tax=Streptomyces sp. NPDC001642 TaxID=3154392 RepID=UPI003326E742